MAKERLVRPRQTRWIAGVCAGLADHFGWNVALVRLLFVLFGLFGAGELVYLALWVLTPNAPR